jgi:hypothetical protein
MAKYPGLDLSAWPRSYSSSSLSSASASVLSSSSPSQVVIVGIVFQTKGGEADGDCLDMYKQREGKLLLLLKTSWFVDSERRLNTL